MHEHDREPVPGLPQELPPGESILWQGSADFQSLLRHSFHIRKLAAYFAALLGLRIVFQVQDGVGLPAAVSSSIWLVVLAAVAMGMLALFAQRTAAASKYTVTTRRVVIRCGIAVPVTINLPFAMIESLDLRAHADGSGDLAIGLDRSGRASYILLWPMVKPFRLLHVRPVLRGLEDGERVADILSDALKEFAVVDRERQLRERADGIVHVDEPPPREKPNTAIIATAAMVVMSLGAVSLYQLATLGDSPEIEAAAEAVNVYFEDLEDGSVLVVHADTSTTIDTLPPESNGFVRGALRSLVRERRGAGIGAEEPFSIRRTADGRVQLFDPATGRLIDLRAFGPTNAGAFARLLDLAIEESIARAQMEVAQQGVAAMASTQQEK